MKKLIPFFCMIVTQPIFAEGVLLFNESKNDLYINYQICYLSSDTKCDARKEIKLSAGNLNGNKNYYHFQPVDRADHTYLYVLSAIEKDSSGNVVAQGIYAKDGDNDVPKPSATCNGSLSTKYGNGSKIIRFNDMNQSPFVACDSVSSTELINP